MFRIFYDELAAAIEEATGQDLQNLDPTYRDYDLLNRFKENAAEFSAAKGQVFLTEAAAAVEIAAVIEQHTNWLATEYEMALANVQMAQKWRDFEASASPTSMLRFQTVGDQRVRHSHRMLDNTTKPMNDPFWSEFYPPIAPRCRCSVIMVEGAAEKSPMSFPDFKQAPAEYRFNAAKTGKMFSDEHPYWDGLTKKKKADLKKWGRQQLK